MGSLGAEDFGADLRRPGVERFRLRIPSLSEVHLPELS